MKKILFFSILFSLLLVSRTFAALTLTASTGITTITASLSGVTNADKYQLVVQPTQFTSGTYTGSTTSIPGTTDPTIQQSSAASSGKPATLHWSLSGYNPNTTYYIRVAEIPQNLISSASYVTPSQTVKTTPFTVYYNDLSVDIEDSYANIKGFIDPIKQKNYQDYHAYLTYSKSPDLSNPIQSGIPSLAYATVGSPNGISDGKGPNGEDVSQDDPAGTYWWVLPGIQPNTTYYMQQTLVLNANNSIKGKIQSFDGSTGATAFVPSSANSGSGAGQNLNPNVYTFLSDPSKSTIFPDPDVCAQEQQQAQAAGKTPPKCSFNDYLNLAIQILIGITGVILVLRLMYVGFEYMTTDLPFKKANAKGQFFTSLMGLLLVLTSYIILNTINPKLVNETVNVQQLAIGVTAPDTDTTPLIQNTGAPTSGAAGACTAGITRVTVQKSSFVACSNYKGIPVATNLQNMLKAAYGAGIKLTGGGFRTAAEQTALRKKHCNGDLYTPNASCNPPTAPVGHSNHESGLAFDFVCNEDKDAISSHSSPCFIWLQNNAATYGFKNFAKEAWHWSIDGR